LVELLHELESDRGRIINSAAVRRLQQKTQVFPLERNAAVRSRLTHSLEVQQTGRFIVRTLYQELGEGAEALGLAGLQPALESLVEMACLMHDIGNPPFGHFGEYAIADWCASHLPQLFAQAFPEDTGDTELRGRMLRDLMAFEGNAQSIRLVARLMRLNLTYSQSATLLKYLRPAYAERPAAGSPGAYLAKKPGFYLSEEDFVARLRDALEMPEGCRHPLTYVMEAADDIAYCLADIEDSVVKGLLDIDTLSALLREEYARRATLEAPLPGGSGSFAELLDAAAERAQREPIDPVGEFFVRLRVSMVHPLVRHAAGQFIEHYPALVEGCLDRALMEDGSLASAVIATFKAVAARHVFVHREVETLQLQGLRILQGLLDCYAPLLRVDAQGFARLVDGQSRHPHLGMLVRRLPRQLLNAYHEALDEHPGSDAPLWEFYHRRRFLLAMVSGMTDQLAEDEYRTLMAL